MRSDFIEKDKCNHIAPVPAHMAAFADIIKGSSRPSAVFETGWNYFALRDSAPWRPRQAS
jgi:hypothetical protein